MADQDQPGEGASPEEQLSRVAECWGRMAQSRRTDSVRGWLDSYQVASERLNAPVAGSPDVNWLVGQVRRLGIPPSSRWLSIGCGSAGQEIISAQAGLFTSLDALDISPAALDEARRDAAEKGVDNISFHELDFNHFEPSPESYDVVFMNMSLHHVKDLDSLLLRVARCLRRDGFLLINEYVGPRQFQFSDLQLSIVKDLLETLPEGLRVDVMTGAVKSEYERRPVEFWNVVDPSEAVRSDLIVPTLDKFFDVVERIDYGGTILHLLLEYIVHNFDNGNEYHLAILRLLARFEGILIDQGVLTSDFTSMALRRKDALPVEAPPPPEVAEPAPGDGGDAEKEALRRELTRALVYIRQVESSRGWKLLQAVRGLFGRRWGL